MPYPRPYQFSDVQLTDVVVTANGKCERGVMQLECKIFSINFSSHPYFPFTSTYLALTRMLVAK